MPQIQKVPLYEKVQIYEEIPQIQKVPLYEEVVQLYAEVRQTVRVGLGRAAIANAAPEDDLVLERTYDLRTAGG